ncbi:MAG: hypothetical protein M0P12_13655, partial [Paludibacteraceae bacterium]|nr:hypothetical protein [Paludibacteraceae bacterium]
EEKNLTLRKYGRVPQSFVFDSRALFKKYDDSAAIIQDLMIFYSYNRLNVNLFGEFEFTMNDFCEAMGYERTTLQRTITELKDPPTLNDHVFDSVFEYALFRSLKEVVIVTRRREGRDEFIPFPLLDYLYVNYDRSTNKLTKRTYVVEFSKKFIKNIFKEYFILDYEDYNRITDKHIDIMGVNRSFYLTICKMITIIRNLRYNTMKEKKVWAEENNTFITTVDQLCDVLRITCTESTEKKRALTKRLNKIQKQLTNTPFQYKYVKSKENSRWKYSIEFHFSNEVLDEYDEKLRAKFLFTLLSRCEMNYGKINSNYGTDIIRGKLTQEQEENFIEWFMSDKDMYDQEILDSNQKYIRIGKFSIFKEVYKDVYAVPYKGNDIDFSLIRSQKSRS